MRTVKTISLSLTPETHEQIKKIAKDNYQSVSGAITQLIWAAAKASAKETGSHEEETK